MTVDIDYLQADHVEVIDEWWLVVVVLDVVQVVEVLLNQDMVLLENDVVVGIDIDVAVVMDVQELLVVVERCLEGTEEVTNPNDVGYYVDDDHHSFDGIVKMLLVYDVFQGLDEEVDDVSLDELLGLDDEVQSPLLADFLPVQKDEYYLLHIDVLVDADYVDDAILVVLLLDDFESFDVVLFLYQDNNDDYNSQLGGRCQSPGC